MEILGILKLFAAIFIGSCLLCFGLTSQTFLDPLSSTVLLVVGNLVIGLVGVTLLKEINS